jgi:hypothetical protein
VSYRYLNAAWELELPSHLKIVLLSLADQANDDGECWPSQETIGRRCGTTTRQVSANLRTLRDLGHLEMVRRRRRKTAVYRLLMVDRNSTSGQADASDQERNPTSGDEPQDRNPDAIKTGSALPTNHKRTITQTEPSPTRAHSVEVVERDGHAYDVEIDQRTNPHDVMAYAMVDAMGWAAEDVTEPQWGTIHRAAKELTRRSVEPDEVSRRAQNYRANHPDWTLTPSALVKWWADSARIHVSPSRAQVTDLAAAAERRNWRRR